MYFPYLRGRQYELLALRELAQGGLLGNHVIPVVEPLKITSTFSSAIKVFTGKNQPIALIINPAVGDLSGGVAVGTLLPSIAGSVIPAVIIGKETSEAVSTLTGKGMPTSGILTFMDNRDYLDIYQELFSDIPPKFTLFPGERQFRRTITENKVLFEDKFKKQDKNADYTKQEDEFFSDDHLYFLEEGFVGFGDYSVIGDEYIEGGFAPRAVAIHIVYFSDDDTLRVYHFVSDSNADTEDTAGKYYEAIIKLKKWYDAGQSRQLTSALSILLSHAESGYYPGLPTIKKLSIMHHLELVGKYLDGGLDRCGVA
ncbi:MAG: sce7725 family protein [Oscillospiraceae bacterium]|nr:sce7725 family protein [Oscillospiraceae bacterium]